MRAEARRKLISCYERTPQGVIKREEFIMPALSSKTSSTSTMSNVSDLPSDFVVELMAALPKKYDESQQFTRNLLIVEVAVKKYVYIKTQRSFCLNIISNDHDYIYVYVFLALWIITIA